MNVSIRRLARSVHTPDQATAAALLPARVAARQFGDRNFDGDPKRWRETGSPARSAEVFNAYSSTSKPPRRSESRSRLRLLIHYHFVPAIRAVESRKAGRIVADDHQPVTSVAVKSDARHLMRSSSRQFGDLLMPSTSIGPCAGAFCNLRSPRRRKSFRSAKLDWLYDPTGAGFE
jgi:hypothetical protein